MDGLFCNTCILCYMALQQSACMYQPASVQDIGLTGENLLRGTEYVL